MVHINGKDMDVAGQSLMAYLEANDYEKGTLLWNATRRSSIKRITKRTS